jgi:hypothetical protein
MKKRLVESLIYLYMLVTKPTYLSPDDDSLFKDNDYHKSSEIMADS